MNLRNFCTTYLRVIIGTLSSLFCLITAFHIPVSFLAMLPFCLIPSAILLLFYEKKGKVLGDRALLVCLLLIGIIALLFRTWIPDAIGSISYYIQKELISVRVLAETDLYIPSEQFYAIVPFFALCTVLLTCLLVLCIERFRFAIIPLLLTVPLVESGLYFGAVPNYYYFFPYIIFFLVSLSLIRFRKKPIPKGFFSAFTFLLVISLILSNTILHAISYERPKKWDQIRNSIILQDYDALSSLLGFSIPTLFSNSYSEINAGNLKGLGNKEKSNKTALIVSMPANLSTVYLKGYVGTNYTKNEWNVQSEQVIQKALPSFYENSKTSISPLDYLSIDQNRNCLYQAEMTITPKSANKNYAYVPYTMLPNESVSSVQDLYYTPKKKSSYTISYGVEKGTTPITNVSYPTASELKNAYSNYVKTYANVSSDVQKQLQEATQAIKDYAAQNDLSYIEAIYWYFAQSGKYEYTLKPGDISGSTDATLYFLNESHKGYCVHFASATTLLLQNLGIPARYVEGYIIPPTTIAKGNYDTDTNSYTFSVPVSNAHAWTEYYVDGSGWVVLDTTPSSYYESIDEESTTETSTSHTSSTTEQEPDSTTEASTTETSTVDSETDTTSSSSSKQNTVSDFSLSDWFASLSSSHRLSIEIVLAIFVLFLLLLIRRVYHLYMRSKAFHQGDNKKRAVAMLEWLFYLFTIKRPSKAEQNILSSRMKPLFDRAKYSQHTITNEELEEIQKFITLTEKKTKKHLSLPKRFFHQFLSKKILR